MTFQDKVSILVGTESISISKPSVWDWRWVVRCPGHLDEIAVKRGGRRERERATEERKDKEGRALFADLAQRAFPLMIVGF